MVEAGKQVSPDQLNAKIYLPGRKGSLQVELLAATRSYDLIPYVIEPSLADLMAELRADRPVLVLQNLGLAAFSLWHYGVVIGYDPDNDTIILRSGTVERQVVPARRFLVSWRQSGGWAMVALRPGEMPTHPDRKRYLGAVAALEQVGRYQAALAGYQAALQHWPDDDTALLGLGNSYYQLKRLDEAEKTYRQLVKLSPGQAIGWNNLAELLAGQGRYTEALGVLGRGLALTGSKTSRKLLQQTRDEIKDRQQGEKGHN